MTFSKAGTRFAPAVFATHALKRKKLKASMKRVVPMFNHKASDLATSNCKAFFGSGRPLTGQVGGVNKQGQTCRYLTRTPMRFGTNSKSVTHPRKVFWKFSNLSSSKTPLKGYPPSRKSTK
jgi:hypothetical protein